MNNVNVSSIFFPNLLPNSVLGVVFTGPIRCLIIIYVGRSQADSERVFSLHFHCQLLAAPCSADDVACVLLHKKRLANISGRKNGGQYLSCRST
jgi:hypothetical protein